MMSEKFKALKDIMNKFPKNELSLEDFGMLLQELGMFFVWQPFESSPEKIILKEIIETDIKNFINKKIIK